MTEADFEKLLRAHQECLFDEKKFRAILSDLFPTELQMNNILVNLFHLGLPREIEEIEVINDPVYYKYKKRVIKTYGIDQKLADEGIRLWMFCYGKAVLNRDVKVSAIAPYVDDDATGTGGQSPNGIKERSFANCPFKITLPQLSLLTGMAKVKFKFLQSRPGISVDVVLNEVYLSDRLGRKYDQYLTGVCKTKDQIQKEIVAGVLIENKNFLTSDATIVLYFLAGDGRKYEVCYTVKRDTGISLDYVMGRHLSEDEELRLEENISERQKIDHSWEQANNQTDDEDDEDDTEDIPPVTKIPKIEEYKKALLREKYFLQKEGGRKYRVTNGHLINQKNGLSTYSFELEAELNLTDDAPISLSVGSIQATGSVLTCEGFQIVIVCDRDFGQTIGSAFIGVEPWKLLEALVNKLDNVSSVNRLALKLIQDGPDLATKGTPDMIPKGQPAALKATKNGDITVIWGPPGTGKTYTMAQIAKDGLKNGKSVLIVSHSNVSVDGVVKQTVESLRKAEMGDLLKKGKVLRYGYVRDEELSADPYAVAYNYVMVQEPSLKTRMEALRKEKERLIGTGEYRSAKGERVEKDLKELRALIRTGERQYVEKASLVATTISKVTVDPLFEDRRYDIVMFDEVSMAYVPQIVCAAMYAAEKLVLVGDFRQLAPIVQSEARSVLGVDIFSYLGIASGTKIYPHPWLVMLNEQRRMHPAISAFPNKYIYHNLLVDHDDVQSNRTEIIKKKPLAGSPINLINLTGTYCAAMKNSDNSRFNILSAIIAFSTAIQAEKDGEDSIGVITPYAAQTRLVRAMIQDYRENEETNVACSTVHQFQGSQRDLIIFDAVESYPSPKVGFLMGKDLDAVTRLINVAITRAKGKLIVAANGGFWERKYEGTPHIFYRLIKYLMSSGKVIGVKDKSLAPYIAELPAMRNLRRYDAWNDALDAFGKDVERAHEKIVISIPDGQLDPEIQAIILKIILKAASNGIRILCKSAGYADLPDGWKNITWGSENSVFPLIVIDDKTAWYGLLKSRGRFNDGNTGFVTVCQTIYRIRGSHTLEMIKAFSDLEYRVVNEQRKPLTEKKASDMPLTRKKTSDDDENEDDGKGPSGLDSFVRKKEKCPKCKSPMTLTRGRSGKCYLKCTSSACKETALLSRDLANWYIDSERVTCPIHHCGIHAGLNQYGIYIRCDHGHYMKPDEI